MTKQIKPKTAPAPRAAGPKPVAQPASKTSSKLSPKTAPAPRGEVSGKMRPKALAKAAAKTQPARGSKAVAGRPSSAISSPPPPRLSVAEAQPAEPAAFQPRVYEALDIACNHQNPDLTNCGAQAGEPCVWQQPGMEGTCHAERIANAAAASQREGTKPTKAQFDQAVTDSGLF